MALEALRAGEPQGVAEHMEYAGGYQLGEEDDDGCGFRGKQGRNVLNQFLIAKFADIAQTSGS